MAQRTEHGFQTKQLLCEVLTDGFIRILNTRTGLWVTVQQSDKGTKQWVSCGEFGKDELARYLSANTHYPER